MTTIRDATPDDIAAITAIYDHHVRTGTASFELDPPDVPEMLRRYQATRDGGYPYIVLEVEAEVIGYAYGGAYRPRKAYRFTVEDSIYLRHDMGGQGYGRLLLDHLMTRFRADGYRSVIGIISDPDVNAPSVSLHKAAGFVEFGRAKEIGFKFDRWIDVAYLQCIL